MKPNAGIGQLGVTMLIVMVLLICAALTVPHLLRGRLYCEEDRWYWTGRKSGCEAMTTSALRTLNTAEVTYQSTYNSGFTDGLHRLAPPPSREPDVNHADLVDHEMAGLGPGGSDTSFVKYAHRFTYRPGPGAFGGIKSYVITVRPLKYGDGGYRSFYTDQTAVIRATSEDREATAKDPPI